jgi:hypothetical protein
MMELMPAHEGALTEVDSTIELDSPSWNTVIGGWLIDCPKE